MNTLVTIYVKNISGQQKAMQMKMRQLALEYFKQGHSRTQIAQSLMVSRIRVNKWIHICLNKGLERLQEKSRTSRPAFLTVNLREQLSQYIEKK